MSTVPPDEGSSSPASEAPEAPGGADAGLGPAYEDFFSYRLGLLVKLTERRTAERVFAATRLTLSEGRAVMIVAAHWFIAASTTSPDATPIPPAAVAEKLVPADPSTPVVVCVRSRVSPVDEYHVEITASDAVPDGSDTLTVDDATADARTYRPRRIDPVDAPAAVVPDVVSAIFAHPDPDRSGKATV